MIFYAQNSPKQAEILARRIADVHAVLTADYINRLHWTTEDKTRLLAAVVAFSGKDGG